MSSFLCARMLRHFTGKVDLLLKIPAKLDAMLFPVTGTKATSRSEEAVS